MCGFVYLLNFTGKTTEQIIEDILEHEKEKTGIDWKAAAAGGEKEWKEAREKAQSYLNDLKSKLGHDETERAKQMGILTPDGKNIIANEKQDLIY